MKRQIDRRQEDARQSFDLTLCCAVFSSLLTGKFCRTIARSFILAVYADVFFQFGHEFVPTSFLFWDAVSILVGRLDEELYEQQRVRAVRRRIGVGLLFFGPFLWTINL